MMQDGGILFSVMPYGEMVRGEGFKTWRRDSLLANNTLLSVVTLPPELFYPTSAVTVGIFVKKGVPHPAEQPVLWLRAIHDGMVKIKGKRLPSASEPNDYDLRKEVIKAFLRNPNMPVDNIMQVQKASPIDFDDEQLELVPENYLDQPQPDVVQLMLGAEKLVRGTVAFVIQEGLERGI